MDGVGMAIEPLEASDPLQVGSYQIVGRVGAGGMGVVYLGQRDETFAAVKVMRPELASSAEFRERFRREAEMAKRLDCPRIARLLDADIDGGTPYVAHEYVPGASVADYVDEHGPLTETALIWLARGLCEAMAAMHSAGVVHRDLTPGNVLLAANGPVVVDFGVARGSDSARLTSTGAVIGTPAWMSPEQLRGDDLTAATDVWAWGAMMAFAATGHAPFGADRAESVMYRALYEAPGLDEIADPLKGWVDAALSKDEAARPSSDALAAAMSGPAVAPAPQRPSPSVRVWQRSSGEVQTLVAPGANKTLIRGQEEEPAHASRVVPAWVYALGLFIAVVSSVTIAIASHRESPKTTTTLSRATATPATLGSALGNSQEASDDLASGPTLTQRPDPVIVFTPAPTPDCLQGSIAVPQIMIAKNEQLSDEYSTWWDLTATVTNGANAEIESSGITVEIALADFPDHYDNYEDLFPSRQPYYLKPGESTTFTGSFENYESERPVSARWDGSDDDWWATDYKSRCGDQ